MVNLLMNTMKTQKARGYVRCLALLLLCLLCITAVACGESPSAGGDTLAESGEGAVTLGGSAVTDGESVAVPSDSEVEISPETRPVTELDTHGDMSETSALDGEGDTESRGEGESLAVNGTHAAEGGTGAEAPLETRPETQSEAESETLREPPEVLTLAPIETPTMPDPDVVPDEAETALLPRIDIKTEGGVAIESKEFYVNSTLSVSDCDAAYALDNVAAQVRVRGNSTATAPKKPYRIKFITKQSMLGLNGGEAFKSWCLMADYFDASMLRTWATFKMADVLLGNKYYSADCTPVEVYVNNDYMGVYLLCEQTQINKDRINITEKVDGATNLDIGYLMIGQGGRFDEPESIQVFPEITVRDRNGDEMYFGVMNFALSGSGYTDEQKAYVSKYVSAVFKVVASALYEDTYYALDREGNMTPYPRKELVGMTKQEKQIYVIDKVFCIESAVRMCMLDEIAKNLDAMTFNMYVDLSPTGDGRLTLAAPWDFDFAMGNTGYATTHSTSGFYATNLSYSEGMRTNLWYVMLGSIDWFEDMMKEQWQLKFPRLLEIAKETLNMTYRYADAYDRDWAKWGAAANRGLIHHHCAADLQTFARHADNGRFVYRWLIKRLEWLDTQWGDGTYVPEPEPERPPAEPFVLDLTKQENLDYFKDFKRCEAEITSQGLKATATALRNGTDFDPYFTFDLSKVNPALYADDYPILEIEYMIPTTNSLDTPYFCEFFLCAGAVTQFGSSVLGNVEMGIADGQWHTLRVDLSQQMLWTGDVHAIRLDFFTVGNVGDSIYMKSIALKPQ